ncbi:hypothetical protein QE152_g35870 [Popillia japonica]|uniref:Uncharacterized protein n=1 Tax=Popillia japonica TaxID=7064 RepID=A0AAW1IE14_POPJA
MLKEIEHDGFPACYRAPEEKKVCYSDALQVTETGASIQLQALLNHTTERLLYSRLDEIDKFTCDDLTLISKWGCDGASGQSEYK